MKGFKVITKNDIEAELELYHREGAKEGKYLGFKSMEPFYSMRQDSCTDWTGLPQSGKTELMLECLYNTSAFYGWKHLLQVPDIGDSIEVMAILIHKHTGKTFDKKYRNYIDMFEVWKACDWLFEHFHIMQRVDRSASISPIEFWDYAVEYKKEFGINTAVIDSWKDLRHDYHLFGGTYAQYLSQVLPYRNALSEDNNIHFHTVIHPKTPRRGKDGKLQHPDVDDMEGGAQWNNSGKTIVSVHRETWDTKVADIKILKAKPKVIGRRGMFALNFDPEYSRYYDINPENGGTVEFAKMKEAKTTIQPNTDFTESINDEKPF